MSEPIEVSDYAALIAALRARIVELGIIYDAVDKIGGLPAGYAGKILAEWPSRGMGAISLFPVLQCLGLRMKLEPDPAAVERLSQRSDWYLVRRGGERFRPRRRPAS